MKSERELLQQALEALEDSVDLVRNEYAESVETYRHPNRKAKLDGMKALMEKHENSITAIRARLAQPDSKAGPVAWRIQIFDAEERTHSDVWWVTADPVVVAAHVKRNAKVEPLYTHPTTAHEAVRKAIEAAAEVCAIVGEEYGSHEGEDAASQCEKGIRALKPEQFVEKSP